MNEFLAMQSLNVWVSGGVWGLFWVFLGAVSESEQQKHWLKE